jgi:hypothetical protein
MKNLKIRKLNSEEINFISILIKKSTKENLKIIDLEKLYVSELEDGGMGSLRFLSNINNENRTMKSELIECFFNDLDGVKVSATINIDNYGELFELDIWKVNFNKLIRLPKDEDSIKYGSEI